MGWTITQCDDTLQEFVTAIIVIIRPLCSTTHIHAAYCYRPSVTLVSPAKMAPPIEMPFGLRIRVSPRNHILDGVQISPWEGAFIMGKGAADSYAVSFVKKTVEPIEMPFGLWTRVGLRKHVLHGVHTGSTWWIPLNRPSATAMQPFCQITLTTCYYFYTQCISVLQCYIIHSKSISPIVDSSTCHFTRLFTTSLLLAKPTLIFPAMKHLIHYLYDSRMMAGSQIHELITRSITLHSLFTDQFLQSLPGKPDLPKATI